MPCKASEAWLCRTGRLCRSLSPGPSGIISNLPITFYAHNGCGDLCSTWHLLTAVSRLSLPSLYVFAAVCFTLAATTHCNSKAPLSLFACVRSIEAVAYHRLYRVAQLTAIHPPR